MSRIVLFVFSFIVLPFSYIHAQNNSLRNYNINHGLPMNIITALYQDQEGYLWVGTQAGLCRFDGFEFYNIDEEIKIDDEKYSNSFVQAIFEDRNKVIWIGTKGEGLSYYDKKTQKKGQIKNPSCDNKKGEGNSGCNDIKSIVELGENTFLVGTAGAGLFIYNTIAQSFQEVEFKVGSEKAKHIKTIYEKEPNHFWVGTEAGLFQYDAKHATIKQFHSNDFAAVSNSLANSSVTVIYGDSSEILWLGTDGHGLFSICHDTIQQYINPYATEDATHNKIWGITKGKASTLWIGAYSGGLSTFDTKRKEFYRENIATHEGNNNFNTSITNMLEDEFDHVWIGTNVNGVYQVSKEKVNYTRYAYNQNDSGSLGSEKVWSILVDKQGELWTGNTWGGGLNLFVPSTQSFKAYKSKDGLSDDNVFSLLEDRTGNLFAGTDSGLNVIDREVWSVKPLYRGAGKYENKIWHLFEDRSGNIWVSTYDGLLKLPPLQGDVDSWWEQQAQLHLDGLRVWLAYEDSKGLIWVGTYPSGLYVYDPKDASWTHFLAEDPNPIINNNTISVVFEDGKGFIWIGTYGGGISRINPTDSSIQVITTNDGLGSNSVYGLIEDHKGDIWISTTAGISKIRKPETKEQEPLMIQNFSLQDFGMQDFNQGVILKDHQYLYFGGQNGFIKLHPDSIRINTNQPKICFSNLIVDGYQVTPHDDTEILSTSIAYTDHIELTPNDNTFSVDVSGLHFERPHQMSFEYILEGHMKHRIKGSNRQFTFSHLPPRDYTLKVKAITRSGVSSDEISLNISVLTPLWKQLWFILLVIVLIIAVIAFFIYQHITKIQAEGLATREKLRALMAQIQPHFLFNLLSSIQYFINDHDTEKAKAYLLKVSNFIRSVLDSSTDSNEVVSLNEELRLIEGYIDLERLRLRNKFIYTLQCDPEINRQTTLVPSLLLQPIIENAIKHGIESRNDNYGLLTIEVIKQKEFLICNIRDNGLGIEHSSKKKQRQTTMHNSLGLTITKERLEKWLLNHKPEEVFTLKNYQHADGSIGGASCSVILPDIAASKVTSNTRKIQKRHLQEVLRSF